MKCIYSEVLGSEPNPAAPFGLVVRAIIVSEEEPESLEITGADVEGLGDKDIIATGSVLITPDTNYIAVEDGVFMAKSGSGGGGGGGSAGGSLKVTFWYDLEQEEAKCDKTYNEVAAAHQTGKFIYGFANQSSDGCGYGLNLYGVFFNENAGGIVFHFRTVPEIYSDEAVLYEYMLTPDNAVFTNEYRLEVPGMIT